MREPINDGEEKVECSGNGMGECAKGGEEFTFGLSRRGEVTRLNRMVVECTRLSVKTKS